MDTRTLLKLIGGQAAIAKECGISESAVSQWVDDDAIPPARSMYLKLAHPGDHWEAYGEYIAQKQSQITTTT
jgi:DNA-binding transcriptional regulator YdaS (Cro superfamily)